MGDGTANGLMKYLDNLIDKGKGSQGAIGPLKIAFAKVMQTVDGSSWQSVQIRNVDADDYMARFTNLTLGKYSSESLTAYRSRFGKVLDWYLRFLEQPGWTPSIQRRAPRKPKSILSDNPAIAPTQASAIDPPATVPTTVAPSSIDTAPPQAVPANTPDRITYPYPLSDGQLVHFSLPLKLSKTDARRIGAFIESIAVGD